MRLFTRHAKVPAVLYGPGDVLLAHAANEQVPLDELVIAAEVLTTLICRVVG
jgi:acetylornithine deacetylase/succinyl-diaminopimelate desuccinylase-like protein